MNKQLIWVRISLFCFLISSGSSNGDKSFELPYTTDRVWHYEVKGFLSTQKYPPPPPRSEDQLSRKQTLSKLPDIDTLKINVVEIDSISEKSILYTFNFDLVRFWGDQILKLEDGYQYYWGSGHVPKYIVKYPVKMGTKWTNRLLHEHDDCEITAIDTTILIGEQTFKNCIEITVDRIGQVKSRKIKIYMNEKVGLVYYKDYSVDFGDEIRLLNAQ